MNAVYDILDKSCRKNPNKPAIIFDDLYFTYDEIFKKTQSLSNYIQENTSVGDVVSIISENSINFIISYFSILKSGCITHIIPPNISDTNMIQQITNTNPELILFNQKNLKQKLIRTNLIDQSYFVDFDLINNSKSAPNDFYGNQYYDISSIIFTSGTTSKPKGVMLSHKNILTATKNIVNFVNIQPTDIEINTLSLSHSFGLGCVHAIFMQGGTSLIFRNSINLNEIVIKGKKELATGFTAVPLILYRIIDSFSDFFSSISSMRYILTNTTTLTKDSILKVNKLFPHVNFYTYYGLTEASRSTFLLFNQNLDKLHSVGRPASGVKIKILDDDKNILPLNEIGEIYVKGDHVIKNYWKNSEADTMIENDWLKTGDLGYLDSDGHLFLKGRKDDMINVGGEKFTPDEIEKVIKELSGIDEVVVLGKYDEFFGQLPVGFVVKNDDAITSMKIIEYCNEKLERYKIPKQIIFLDSFPKTDSGKIQRNILKLKTDKLAE